MKTFTISINKKITPDISIEDANRLIINWETSIQEWSEEKALETVRTIGLLPTLLVDDKRIIESADCVASIMLNFDEGESFFEMKDRVTTWNYSALLFDSLNGKLRIWMPLKEKIDMSEFVQLMEYLKEQFPTLSDTSSNRVRYYYPSPAEKNYFHNRENFFDAKEIINSRKKKTIDDRQKERKETHFSAFDYVLLENGDEVVINTIEENTSIVCRYCDLSKRKNSHNAFITKTGKGIYYQHCRSENKTRWQEPTEVDAYKNMDLFVNDVHGKPCVIYNDGRIHNFFDTHDDWTNYCNNEGLDVTSKKYLPRLKLTFDMKLPFGKNLEQGVFNIYKESETLREAKENKIPESEATIDYLKLNCPITYAVLDNLFGDDLYVDYFLNWIAYILKGNKSFTCWMISSVQGAGKNLMFEKIISPIIGEKHALCVGLEKLTDKFNAFEEQIIFKAVNEVFLSTNEHQNNFNKQYIKNVIGSTTRLIEGKGTDPFIIPNYLHYLLFTNEKTLPFNFDDKDRRFSIIRNEKGKEIRKEEWYKGDTWIRKTLAKELSYFTKYIVSRPVDEDSANTPLVTEIKRNFIEASKQDTKSFFDLIKSEKWDEFQTDEFEDELGTTHDNFIKECVLNNGIPAKYFRPLMQYHLGEYGKRMKDKLKLLGLKDIVAKSDDGKSIRIYRVKQQVGNDN